MPIKLTKDTTEDPLIEAELLIQTIEKNRDRLRTTAGMIMSLSGISLSASLAIMFFALQRRIAAEGTVILIVLAAVAFFCGAIFSIEASFFRREYIITTRSQFIADLLKLFAREMRFVRIASVAALLGLGLLAAAITVQAITSR